MKTSASSSVTRTAEQQLRAKLRQASKQSKTLQKSEALWTATFRFCPVALSVASLSDGRLIEVNHLYLQMTGYAHEELVGRPVGELYPATETTAETNPYERMQKLLEDGFTACEVTSVYWTKAGAARDALWSLQVIEVGKERYVLAATMDIGESKQREQELSQQVAALTEQLKTLESENSQHLEQKQKLVNQISELCDQANLLKFDVIRLRQMQQELMAEIERLRTRTGLLKAERAQSRRAETKREQTDEPAQETTEPAPQADETSATPPAASPEQAPPVEWTPPRRAISEEQLLKHVMALREAASRIETEVGQVNVTQN